MRRALDLAAATRPHPNPRVGAVVLSAGGEPVAEAAHEGPGSAHAEAAAVRAAGAAAAGGTVVVTLEPCVHRGRTLPCVEALISAGVARIVIGAIDPDERVSGRGVARLREAGIEVSSGVLADAVVSLDPAYFHHRTTGRPRITVKTAMTLDGQTAAADRTSQWITSPAAREDGHSLRAGADAVVVGAGTVISDDPVLTARGPFASGPQPRPVVVAGRRPLPSEARVFARHPLVFSPTEIDVPAETVIAPGPDGVELEGLVKHLGAAGLLDVLVEGGPTLAGAMLRAGLVDQLVVYVGAKVAGGAGIPVFDGEFATLSAARPVTIEDARMIGPDVRITATVRGEG